MTSTLAGFAFLLFFVVSQGLRDVFFGRAFQSTSFLFVAALAFAASTAFFGGVSILRRPKDLCRMLMSAREFAVLNLSTGGSWLAFFFGLTFLEPAVVATLFNGIGPLAVLMLTTIRASNGSTDKPTGPEWACYGGVAASLSALIVVVLDNQSSLPNANLPLQASALLAVSLGGILIAHSHLVARRFSDRGIGSDVITGTRFVFAMAAACMLELIVGSPSARPGLSDIPYIALIAFALIAVPGFVLQLGIARTSPLAVNVIRSTAPLFVFAVQQFDGRLRFSGATLLCLVAFAMFASVAAVLRAWHEIRPALPRHTGAPQSNR